jgi:hypothetical protein
MISDDPAFTDPAMAVIKRTDPDAYEKIAASPWRVYTADNTPGNIFASLPPDIHDSIAEDFNKMSFAVTTAEHPFYKRSGVYVPPGYRRYLNTTWLNMPLLRAYARVNGIPLADALADTLIHEYVHYSLGFAAGERPAYEADLAFARKLPASDHVIVAEAQAGLEAT